MHNKLNEMLFAEMLAGKRFVLIVDEAQKNLDDSGARNHPAAFRTSVRTSHCKLLQPSFWPGNPSSPEKLGQKRQAQLLRSALPVVKRLDTLYRRRKQPVISDTG